MVENFLFGQENFEFSDDDSLMGKGIIDSTGVLELVAFIQESFGIQVDDRDLIPENLDSISNVMRFLATKEPAAG
ncbi:MAG: acyl carrier protein [Terriglobia bacterium]